MQEKKKMIISNLNAVVWQRKTHLITLMGRIKLSPFPYFLFLSIHLPYGRHAKKYNIYKGQKKLECT